MLASLSGTEDNPPSLQIIQDLKAAHKDFKGLNAPGGWAFLINDTNDFFSWQFGLNCWNKDERAHMHAVMTARQEWFRSVGIPYLMVITPEKSAVYREYLPSPLDVLPESSDRPASYLADSLQQIVALIDFSLQKRQGLLYFRSDTHVNWLGGYHIYRKTIEAACSRGIDLGRPIPFSRLRASAASWKGDVLSQIRLGAHQHDIEEWKPEFLNEVALQFDLLEHGARRLADPDVFRIGRPTRETIVTEHKDKSLPKAVIFRDSTANMCIDLLAEHFSRAVFIWHHDDVIGDVIQAEQPNVVLHLKADRFISSYLNTVPVTWGWKP